VTCEIENASAHAARGQEIVEAGLRIVLDERADSPGPKTANPAHLDEVAPSQAEALPRNAITLAAIELRKRENQVGVRDAAVARVETVDEPGQGVDERGGRAAWEHADAGEDHARREICEQRLQCYTSVTECFGPGCENG